MEDDKNHVSGNDGDNFQDKMLKSFLKIKSMMVNLMWMFFIEKQIKIKDGRNRKYENN